MKLQPTIGLEIHVQLSTATKMFCRCSVGEAAPNTHCCPTCLGLPGTLPVPNKGALMLATQAANLLGCVIGITSVAERKSYSYPDLPKGYQISQFSSPFAEKGVWKFHVGVEEREVRIRRIQIEEDTAQMRVEKEGCRLDFNRSGIPLLEIVTEPDFTESKEVGAFLRTIRASLVDSGLTDGKMEAGSLRCEPNISWSFPDKSGTKVEIKNLGSIRGVERAINWELAYQKETLDGGGKVEPVTKGWDEKSGRCILQRRKETASDYRYFPEPDLPPLAPCIDELQEENRVHTPFQRGEKLLAMGVAEGFSWMLSLDLKLFQYWEEVVTLGGDPLQSAKWVAGPLVGAWREAGLMPPGNCPNPRDLATLLGLVEKGTISKTVAKGLIPSMITGANPVTMVEAGGLAGGVEDLERLALLAIEENPDAAQKFQSGKEGAIRAVLGTGMRLSRGKADPQALLEAIRIILKA